MGIPGERLSSLLLLLLLGTFFATYIPHSVSADDLVVKSRLLTQQHFPSDFVPDNEQRENYRTQGGNDVVHEIWSILRDFEPTWKDGVTSTRSPGVLGAVWYYTKVVFRLLFINAPTKQNEHTGDDVPKLKGDLTKAVEALEHAARYDDPDAIFLLAEMNFYGNFSHPRNHHTAFRRYSELATLDGNSTAQYMLGFLYATGIGGAVERDQAKALLYHTFAAEQSHVRSEMTVAHRYHSGIGTARDCEKAVSYYKRVADKAMGYWQSGPPGGRNMPRNAYKWAEESGGVYGEGASASTSGHNAPQGTSHNIEDIVEFLDMREKAGDFNAMFNLGKYYYDGTKGLKRNVRKAQRQFMKIARAYWNKDGKVNPKAPKGIEKTAAKAAAYIGRMFLRGEGMEQDFDKAATWFRRGLAGGDSFCQYHLGLMYREGLGVPKDALRAATFFKAAAEQDLAVAQSAMGVLFLDQGDIDTAGRYLELAARHGLMEAFYYLAELINNGVGRERNCQVATAYYKIVVERAEALHSSFNEANAAYENGDLERALIPMTMAAEQGYEVAQANVAYLLDEKTSVIPVPAIPLLGKPRPRGSLLRNAALALIYWTRSAKQSNIDSLVKMGDYYLAGYGTGNSLPDLDKASTCYTSAAESHHSAQALWNLGWMHENGIGPVAQDFHMAKRYYDLALEMNSEAYLPVKLALARLRIRSWYNGISGGKINSIRDEPKEEGTPRTLTEWITQFLDNAEEMEAHEATTLVDDMELDGDLYAHDPLPGAEGDGYYEDFDDGLFESMIIISLAAALAFLVYYRQQRQQQQRRLDQAQGEQPPPAPAPAQGQGFGIGLGGLGIGLGQQVAPAQEQNNNAPAANEDRGFFPNPGDPDWNQWVAGGVGH